MPNGKIHHAANKKLFPLILAIAAVSALVDWQISFWVLYWFWLGVWYISPDWDLVGMNSDESRMLDDLWIVGALMYSLSTFYGWFVSQAGKSIGITKIHRSALTHGVFGTLFRVGFINVPLAIALKNYLIIHNMKYDPLFIIWIAGVLPYSYLVIGKIKAKRSRLPNRFRYGVQTFKRVLLLGMYFLPVIFFTQFTLSDPPTFDPVYIAYFVAGQLLALIPPDILHNQMDKKDSKRKMVNRVGEVEADGKGKLGRRANQIRKR